MIIYSGDSGLGEIRRITTGGASTYGKPRISYNAPPPSPTLIALTKKQQEADKKQAEYLAAVKKGEKKDAAVTGALINKLYTGVITAAPTAQSVMASGTIISTPQEVIKQRELAAQQEEQRQRLKAQDEARAISSMMATATIKPIAALPAISLAMAKEAGLLTTVSPAAIVTTIPGTNVVAIPPPTEWNIPPAPPAAIVKIAPITKMPEVGTVTSQYIQPSAAWNVPEAPAVATTVISAEINYMPIYVGFGVLTLSIIL